MSIKFATLAGIVALSSFLMGCATLRNAHAASEQKILAIPQTIALKAAALPPQIQAQLEKKYDIKSGTAGNLLNYNTADIDLDGDGAPELVIVAINSLECGTSVGCTMRAYKKVKDNWLQIGQDLASFDDEKLVIVPQRGNFADLILTQNRQCGDNAKEPCPSDSPNGQSTYSYQVRYDFNLATKRFEPKLTK